VTCCGISRSIDLYTKIDDWLECRLKFNICTSAKKNENYTETETLTVTSTQEIVYSSMSSNPVYVSLPNLC